MLFIYSFIYSFIQIRRLHRIFNHSLIKSKSQTTTGVGDWGCGTLTRCTKDKVRLHISQHNTLHSQYFVDVKNFTVRMDETAVPTNETTYMCQMLDLPTKGGDFHVIGNRPAIDNVNVMHHIVVALCTDKEGKIYAEETYRGHCTAF